MKSSFQADKEKAFLEELITAILRFSYACLCNETLRETVNCEGCDFCWPSQRDHLCMLLTNDPEEAWFYYYKEASESVEPSSIWEWAQDIAFMLDFKIHPSWSSYIVELYKLSRSKVYSTYQEIQRFANIDDQPIVQILKVLNRGELRVVSRQKTVPKAASLHYPYDEH